MAYLDPVLSKALAKDPSDRFDRSREFATKLSERAHFDPESDRSTEAGITVQAPRAGTQTQVAVAKPHGKSAEQGSPSDDEPPPTALTKKRRGRRLILVGAAAAVVLVAAVSATVYMVERKNNAASAPAPVAPPLDGVYRIDIDRTKQTVMGAPLAPDPPDPPAPAPLGGPTGHRAHPKDALLPAPRWTNTTHQQARTPPLTAQFHFVDGHWHRAPSQFQAPYDRCLSADGKSAVKGEDTEEVTWSAEPQSDGTLRGVYTDTGLTNECGLAGVVRQSPIVLTRVGDVPPTVTVADPATVTPE